MQVIPAAILLAEFFVMPQARIISAELRGANHDIRACMQKFDLLAWRGDADFEFLR
jgi:hypothetical protein